MTAVAPQPITARPYPARVSPKGSVLLKMLRTTDPKDIAILYLVTSFGFFMVGGAMALLMRTELARPGRASSPRMSMAISPAARKNPKDVTR